MFHWPQLQCQACFVATASKPLLKSGKTQNGNLCCTKSTWNTCGGGVYNLLHSLPQESIKKKKQNIKTFQTGYVRMYRYNMQVGFGQGACMMGEADHTNRGPLPGSQTTPQQQTRVTILRVLFIIDSYIIEPGGRLKFMTLLSLLC